MAEGLQRRAHADAVLLAELAHRRQPVAGAQGAAGDAALDLRGQALVQRGLRVGHGRILAAFADPVPAQMWRRPTDTDRPGSAPVPVQFSRSWICRAAALRPTLAPRGASGGPPCRSSPPSSCNCVRANCSPWPACLWPSRAGASGSPATATRPITCSAAARRCRSSRVRARWSVRTGRRVSACRACPGDVRGALRRGLRRLAARLAPRLPCEASTSASPSERERHLLEEAVRHVVALHAVVLGPLPVGLHRRAEQVVDEGKVCGVVVVDRLVVLRVVPVVEVGRDDHVAQRTEAHAHVGMVEDRVEADDDDVGVDHLLAKPERVDRRRAPACASSSARGCAGASRPASPCS